MTNINIIKPKIVRHSKIIIINCEKRPVVFYDTNFKVWEINYYFNQMNYRGRKW
jgi:hypothetical protein